IVPDGTDDPGFDRDPELYHQPSSRPGAKLPHAWITSGTRTLSTLDTVGQGRFTLLTGIGGTEWVRAAGAQELEIATVVIGPGQEYEDPYGDWARLSEVADAGALLVRPDGHVAFRHATAPDSAADAERRLTEAVRRILGHA
ncbi:MAG: 2,4-dichlorophenol 6-monooxygenase, partial [Streptomyces sp.]|nr:2,4-dichlorophenol 6-monooxygenase [Streptomyces sp.]